MLFSQNLTTSFFQILHHNETASKSFSDLLKPTITQQNAKVI